MHRPAKIIFPDFFAPYLSGQLQELRKLWFLHKPSQK